MCNLSTKGKPPLKRDPLSNPEPSCSEETQRQVHDPHCADFHITHPRQSKLIDQQSCIQRKFNSEYKECKECFLGHTATH